MKTSPSSPVRVMLVDDHTMVRRGLATFLKVFDDLQLVGEAESGEDAIRLCAEVSPDVILMDMSMPDMDEATTTRLIRQKYPEIQVIALTSFKEGKLIKNVLEAVEAANLPAPPGLDLTERELEVLALMIEGLNNTQIAGRLTVSPSTIKSHVSNILSKLGVTNRTEAVTLALRNGIATSKQ